MRDFGKIATTLWRSKRWRKVADPFHRLVYMYLHTSPHGNSVGAFVVPPELAALDMKADSSLVSEAYIKLQEVGLIRYDDSEELVQIVGFFQYNSFTSRKHSAGSMKVFFSLPDCPLKERVAVDIAVSMYQRAMTWGIDVDARGAFLNDASNLVKSRKLEPLFDPDEIGLSIELLIELSEHLLIDLPILQRQRQRQKQRLKTETETETQTETETAQIGEDFAPAPSSLPAKGSQSGLGGGKKVPPDVADKIASLSEAAKKSTQTPKKSSAR